MVQIIVSLWEDAESKSPSPSGADDRERLSMYGGVQNGYFSKVFSHSAHSSASRAISFI